MVVLYTLWVSIILLLINTGISKAIMDLVQHKYKATIFADKDELFWNPKKSWKNKWVFDPNEKRLKEKFPGSSTFLVFTTDAWHLFQFSTYNSLAVAFFLIGTLSMILKSVIIGILLVIGGLILFKTVFEICYKYIFIKK